MPLLQTLIGGPLTYMEPKLEASADRLESRLNIEFKLYRMVSSFTVELSIMHKRVAHGLS